MAARVYMATSKKNIYWDACVFIAWIYEDKSYGPGVFEGIEFMARDIHSGKSTLFTSVVTKTEVLDNRMSGKAKTRFGNLFKRHNVTMVVQDERIADRSHNIRNHYDKVGYHISTTDAIHLATAIIYKADAFYTLDGAGRKRNGDLLPLDGDVAGYPLTIVKPDAFQGTMFAGAGSVPTVQPKKRGRTLTIVPKASGK